MVPELAQSSTCSGLRRLTPTPAAVERVSIRREIAHPGAAGAQARGCGHDVGSRGRVADVASALRLGAEDERPMADRLVARDADLTVDPGRRRDALVGHAVRDGLGAEHGAQESLRALATALSGSAAMLSSSADPTTAASA